MLLISQIFKLTEAQELTMNSLKELAEFSLSCNWSPFLFKDGYRHTISWSACDVMVLDVDHGCTIEEAIKQFDSYQFAITTTRNHQKIKNELEPACDRFRVIIPLSKRIIDRDIYKNTWYSLSNQYQFIDNACKDFGRFYYQGVDIVYLKETGNKIDPLLEAVIPKQLYAQAIPSGLNKGRLSRSTMEFLFTETKPGEWNNSLFKAAKDFQEQGYSQDEFISKATLITGFLDNKDLNTIKSSFNNDPKYDPRGVEEREELVGMTVNELLSSGTLGVKGETILGPDFWDATHSGWRKGEVLGLIAGSGTGKSSVSLQMIKSIAENSPDELHFFFSLEMPARQVIDRWMRLVGSDSKLSDRLIVIDNRVNSDRLTWQHLVRFIEDTCKKSNKKVGAVILDHFMAISDKIDITKDPAFDVSTDINSGRGKLKTISIKEMCRLMKVVAERLNCFLIVQNQSTKERAAQGDLPMGINAAYGAAQFEWFCDYIMTVWQPLKRVTDQTSLTCTSWQYCKIREKGAEDKVKEYQRYTLQYDLEFGRFRRLTNMEEIEFNKLVLLANEHRKADDKKENTNYKNSPNSSRQAYLRLTKKDGEGEIKNDI